MAKTPENKFKGELKKAFEEAGAMVSLIEPAFGSSPGVPDMAIAWGLKDFWIETKVEQHRIPTVDRVWNDLLRADQRIWFEQREKVLGDPDKVIPAFVAVRVLPLNEDRLYAFDLLRGLHPVEFCFSYFERDLLMIDIPAIVEYFSRYCEILKVEDLKR